MRTIGRTFEPTTSARSVRLNRSRFRRRKPNRSREPKTNNTWHISVPAWAHPTGPGSPSNVADAGIGWEPDEAHDGPVQWYRDKFTGRTMDRPGMDRLLSDLRAGKIERIVVWRLDRLGRTTRGLCQLFDELRERKVDLVSLKDGFSLESPAGRAAPCSHPGFGRRVRNRGSGRASRGRAGGGSPQWKEMGWVEAGMAMEGHRRPSKGDPRDEGGRKENCPDRTGDRIIEADDLQGSGFVMSERKHV